MSREILNSSEIVEGKKIFLMMSKKFLEQVASEITNNPNLNDETGGLILGIREVRKNNDINIIPLGSLNSKDPQELERRVTHLNIGGPLTNIGRKWQVESWSNWIARYSTIYKDFDYNPKNSNLKLTILGIWHKHPGSYIDYSGEDNATIDNILKTPGKPDFLFPVAILRSKSEGGENHIENALKLRVGNDTFVDIKFYFRSKSDGKTQILKPEIYGSNYFPALATPAWYTENPIKFKNEVHEFEKNGFTVDIKHTLRNDLPHPESWLILRKDNEDTYYIRMSYNFLKDKLLFITKNDPDKTEDFNGITADYDKSMAETFIKVVKSI